MAAQEGPLESIRVRDPGPGLEEREDTGEFGSIDHKGVVVGLSGQVVPVGQVPQILIVVFSKARGQGPPQVLVDVGSIIAPQHFIEGVVGKSEVEHLLHLFHEGIVGSFHFVHHFLHSLQVLLGNFVVVGAVAEDDLLIETHFERLVAQWQREVVLLDV